MNADDYRAYVGGTSGLIYGYVNDGFIKWKTLNISIPNRAHGS